MANSIRYNAKLADEQTLSHWMHCGAAIHTDVALVTDLQLGAESYFLPSSTTVLVYGSLHMKAKEEVPELLKYQVQGIERQTNHLVKKIDLGGKRG